jgi:hypothetical protein
MKWPWVSRRAYDTVVEERNYLRDQMAWLLMHVQRMDRVEHGVPEAPRMPRPVLEPIPRSLLSFIDEFNSPSIRKEIRDRCFQRHARGEPWSVIEADTIASTEPAV